MRGFAESKKEKKRRKGNRAKGNRTKVFCAEKTRKGLSAENLIRQNKGPERRKIMEDQIGKMEREKRRDRILSALGAGNEPQSAGALGDRFGVPRQVIVQDIALLRAAGVPIVSTNRGYILASRRQAARIFKVRHTEAEVGEELELIVSLGGVVKNVFVNHRVYGHIEAELNIETRVHAAEFVRSLGGASRPLMLVTEGYHYHTVVAPDEETLDRIGFALKERGFLVEQ